MFSIIKTIASRMFMNKVKVIKIECEKYQTSEKEQMQTGIREKAVEEE